MIISLIAAMDKKGGIGKNKRLPWYLPSDLKRFKQLTMGHYIVMGRKTFESIGKALPGREMLVISHRQYEYPTGVKHQPSLRSAIDSAMESGETELFIIGGSEIFAQAIDIADKIYLTLVKTESDADVFFPDINEDDWHVVAVTKCEKVPGDEYVTEFRILERIH